MNMHLSTTESHDEHASDEEHAWYDAGGPVDENYAKQSIRTDILADIAALDGVPIERLRIHKRTGYDTDELLGELITAAPAERFDGTLRQGDFRYGDVVVGYAAIRYCGSYVMHLILDPLERPSLGGMHSIDNTADPTDIL
jgi:hypothetical protein